MAKNKQKLPNLANATPGFIVDELGRTRVELSRLKKLEGFLKQGLLARAKVGAVTGEKYYNASIQELERSGLDTEAVKKEMGDNWYKERCKTTPYIQIRTVEKPKE